MVATMVAGCASASAPDPAGVTASTASTPTVTPTPVSTAELDTATEASTKKICKESIHIYSKGIDRITAGYASATDAAGREKAAKQTKKTLKSMANQLNGLATSAVDEAARNSIVLAIYQLTAAVKSKDAKVVFTPAFLAIGQKLATDCHVTVNP
jgi:hypothetical protein